MRRVLVTGGAGFLGANLCRKLLAAGDEVWCLDNLRTGQAGNVAALRGNPRFTFREADVTEPVDLDPRFAIVYHLASPASPPAYLRHPLPTLMTGAVGTQRLLELARAGGAVFVLASTSEVYGDPQMHPQPETYCGNVNPVGPRSVYDEAKRFAEALTAVYQREHGVDTRIARIFNTYGPLMRPDDGRVVSSFCCQAIRGLPLTVQGDGTQTRSFCYVDDLVDGLCRLAEVSYHGPVNLGNPAEISVLGLARRIIELAGSASEVAFLPLPADDPRRRCPDVRLARTLLDWEPRVPLEEGLRRTIAYFREVLAGPDGRP